MSNLLFLFNLCWTLITQWYLKSCLLSTLWFFNEMVDWLSILLKCRSCHAIAPQFRLIMKMKDFLLMGCNTSESWVKWQ